LLFVINVLDKQSLSYVLLLFSYFKKESYIKLLHHFYHRLGFYWFLGIYLGGGVLCLSVLWYFSVLTH